MGLESLPLMASQCSNQEVLWSSSELAGWASKRSHGVKTWNHRYCVVKDSFLFYFRDELMHVLRGVIPLEGARLRKPKPLQRSVGSAELRYCLVLDVAAKAADSCRHKQYEFCWNSAEEQSKWARALMLACIPRKALLKEAARSGSLDRLLMVVRARPSEKQAGSLLSEPSGVFMPDIDTDMLASPSQATTPRDCSITSGSSLGHVPSEASAKKRASLLATAVRTSKFGAALQPVQSASAEPQDPQRPGAPASAQPDQHCPPETGQPESSEQVQRQPSTLWELAQAGVFNTPSENELIRAYSGLPSKSGSVIIHDTPPASEDTAASDLREVGAVASHAPSRAEDATAVKSDDSSNASIHSTEGSKAQPPPKLRTLRSLLPFHASSPKPPPKSSPTPPLASAMKPARASRQPLEAAATPAPASKLQSAAQPAGSKHRQSPSMQGCDDAVVDLLTSFLAMAVQQEKQAVTAGTKSALFDAELVMLLEATALPAKARKAPAQAAGAAKSGGHAAPAPKHRRAASQQVTSVKAIAPPIRAESNLLTSLQAEISRRHVPVSS